MTRRVLLIAALVCGVTSTEVAAQSARLLDDGQTEFTLGGGVVADYTHSWGVTIVPSEPDLSGPFERDGLQFAAGRPRVSLRARGLIALAETSVGLEWIHWSWPNLPIATFGLKFGAGLPWGAHAALCTTVALVFPTPYWECAPRMALRHALLYQHGPLFGGITYTLPASGRWDPSRQSIAVALGLELRHARADVRAELALSTALGRQLFWERTYGEYQAPLERRTWSEGATASLILTASFRGPNLPWSNTEPAEPEGEEPSAAPGS